MNRYQVSVIIAVAVFGLSVAGLTSVAAPVAMGAGSVNATGFGISAASVLGLVSSIAGTIWGVLKSGKAAELVKLVVPKDTGDTLGPIVDRLRGGNLDATIIASDVAIAALGYAILTRKGPDGSPDVDQESLRLLGQLSRRINSKADAPAPAGAQSDPQAIFGQLVEAIRDHQLKALQGVT